MSDAKQDGCQAVVASTMWAWFVVPLGAPAVGLAHAYGLLALVGFVTYSPADVRASEKPEGQTALSHVLAQHFAAITVALMATAFGWLATRFM